MQQFKIIVYKNIFCTECRTDKGYIRLPRTIKPSTHKGVANIRRA